MHAPTTKPFDSAVYLDSEEAVAEYLTDALESGDDAFTAHALDLVLRTTWVSRTVRADCNIARDMAARPAALVALTPDLAARIEALTAGLIVHPDERIEGDVAL